MVRRSVIRKRPSETPPITPSLTVCHSAAAADDGKANNGNSSERARAGVTKETKRTDAITRHESGGYAPTPSFMTPLCSSEGAGAV